MSEHEQRHRPPNAAKPGAEEPEDPRAGLVGGGVQADRLWAQQRIANHFAANRIFRKAAGGAEAKHEDVEVSQPGDAAETEADAAGDDVADKLHGTPTADSKPPPISAKLDGVGRKVFLARNK